ncbi:glutaredoxin family protein [Aquitalea sp. S1-19]|uniref:Glutaredoxin family protein n=1 Tax=Craterilacuibacter sinensis TaxID=2686017 RepID=A0A845BKQ9_9NEIS|nr:glutaredoxin family protein [Craterilacuibacter sinensis]MCP9758571.1 glutaredoxin family protein [Aquitalea sp. S1-19]RQW29226.1 glutaredoxin family protein [Rhodobacteraceae bacterium CH30]MCP9760544.1 glutaredoxin family protein [Aquitalea sp. S1-19]MCP9760568.1 glutaredoxin family protein [Aquitalea sp. S1-19]MCP9760580.1 glutaredoxin family protein [Aquitalea sp. S1-19]
MTLTLMFRDYCSLCHAMRDALLPWQARYGFELDIVDVDADPVLEEKYNELVPVLLDAKGEICHWHLDEAALAERLAAHAGEIR